MALKVLDLINEARLSTSLEDPSRWTSWVSIVGQALRHFDAMHAWNFLTGEEASIGTVASQEYVVLPSDLRDVEHMEHTGGVGSWVRWTTRARITQMRAFDQTDADNIGGYFAALLREIPTTGGGLENRAELYPTPSATASGIFALRYRRALGIDGVLNPDTAYVRVPSFVEPTLVELVRLFALGTMEQHPAQGGAPLHQRLEGFRYSSMVMDCMSADGAMQGELGEISGGAAQMEYTDRYAWDTAVEEPS